MIIRASNTLSPMISSQRLREALAFNPQNASPENGIRSSAVAALKQRGARIHAQAALLLFGSVAGLAILDQQRTDCSLEELSGFRRSRAFARAGQRGGKQKRECKQSAFHGSFQRRNVYFVTYWMSLRTTNRTVQARLASKKKAFIFPS